MCVSVWMYIFHSNNDKKKCPQQKAVFSNGNLPKSIIAFPFHGAIKNMAAHLLRWPEILFHPYLLVEALVCVLMVRGLEVGGGSRGGVRLIRRSDIDGRVWKQQGPGGTVGQCFRWLNGEPEGQWWLLRQTQIAVEAANKVSCDSKKKQKKKKQKKFGEECWWRGDIIGNWLLYLTALV